MTNCSPRHWALLGLHGTSPRSAYECLHARPHAGLADVGPATLTKYLYFAGCGDAAHPSCILDGNVALSLWKACGRKSLASHGWPSPTYGRATPPS